MKHLGINGHIRGKEHQHGGHIGMDHAAALGDAPQVAGLALHLKGHGQLLFLQVRGHDGFRRVVAVIPQGLHQGGHPRLDGRKGQRLADHTGGADDHVRRLYAAFRGQQAAHGLCDLHPVGVAGVGVAAVT